MRKITKIRCRNLFGRLNYNVRFDDIMNGHFNIIYGDNGSGKTTLLRLVYSLLSNNCNEGNKSFIAKTPFQNLHIDFSDGSSFTVDRSIDIIGSYSIVIYSADRLVKSFEIIANKEYKVTKENSPEIEIYESELDDSKFVISLITDDRTIYSTDSSLSQTEELDKDLRPWSQIEYDYAHTLSPRFKKAKFNLKALYDQASVDIKDRVIASSFSAQDSINQIYLEIAKRLAEAQVLRASKTTSTTNFLGKLTKFENQYAKYGAFGLIPNIEPSQLRGTVSASPPKRKNAISEALSPLVENALVRYGKLEPILENIDVFLSEVNRFFSGKNLRYNARYGFHIVDHGGVFIDWTWLSSGERQIIFLFGVVFISINKGSIILIDEPEISLNVKWQRMFIDSVERVVRSSDGQFIIASHSMEVIAGHIENVSELNSEIGD